MSSNKLLPEKGSPHSLEVLTRAPDAASEHDSLYQYLKRFATRNVHYKRIDFEEALDTTFWAVANSSGTSAADFAVDAPCGTITGDTGTDDNGSISLISDAIFKGDLNCGMEMAIKIDAVTGLNFEVGFGAAAPGSNNGQVNDEDTPTANGTDFAVVAMDTDETFATLGFYTEGATAGQDPARTSLASIPGLTGGTTPVAATYMIIRVQLVGNHAFCFVNGALAASHNADADGALEGGTGLGIWVYCRTRNTTAKFPTIDYVEYWQDRAY